MKTMQKTVLGFMATAALLSAGCTEFQRGMIENFSYEIGQRKECAQYIECSNAWSDQMRVARTDLSDSYGPDGTCWETRQGGDACSEACVLSTRRYQEDFEDNEMPVPEACILD